jgi:hypothetical protein
MKEKARNLWPVTTAMVDFGHSGPEIQPHRRPDA